ncbi:hypothetical protein [Burkholderia glumae]|uniref:hypothetical protein n=1 Tax=Burkholderia glumae TaxID=337 RepID=UPI00157B93B6|nr:hypothetical protein [Burkholderia glumae]
MENEKVDKFLAQFEASKKNVNEWPEWMRNVAKVATASFPEGKPAKTQDKPESNQKRRK